MLVDVEVKKKKVNAFEIGKNRIAKGKHHINTMVYRDYEGTFIMVKGVRIKIRYKIVNKKIVCVAEWGD